MGVERAWKLVVFLRLVRFAGDLWGWGGVGQQTTWPVVCHPRDLDAGRILCHYVGRVFCQTERLCASSVAWGLFVLAEYFARLGAFGLAV